MTTIDELRRRAESDARTNGCYVNTDQAFLKDLLEGLKKNVERYGYPSCPCRLASGNLELDRDILCPCDYRDPDVAEHGACYCALYVRKDVYEGKAQLKPVLERRPPEKIARAQGEVLPATVERPPEAASAAGGEAPEVKKKLWYCKQCGYVCYREDPPYVCPVCKAKRELFAEITLAAGLRG